jgi:hypothetical protein
LAVKPGGWMGKARNGNNLHSLTIMRDLWRSMQLKGKPGELQQVKWWRARTKSKLAGPMTFPSSLRETLDGARIRDNFKACLHDPLKKLPGLCLLSL